MQDEAPHTDHSAGDREDCRAARNCYFRGKTMKADDFGLEQRYVIGRRRLVTRAALGWGVVHGLRVEGPHMAASHDDDGDEYQQEAQTAQTTQPAQTPPSPRCDDAGPLAVGPGLALDRHGREIDVHATRRLGPGNTFLVEKDGESCRPRPLGELEEGRKGRYLLSIHYAERRFGDAKLPDECGCEDPQKNYVCETAVFSLQPIDRCPCGEPPCRRCKCGAWSRCRDRSRGPHACLCEWSHEASADGESRLCEWHGYYIDPDDGVALACVVVETRKGKCGVEIVGCIEDACSPRRLVKTNDLLYDLIRGCDLARISWVSWAQWHRRGDKRMTWSDFEGMFTADGRTEFVVRFSEPVLTSTLKRDVIMIAVVTREPGTGWRVPRRIPIIDLDLSPHDELPAGYQKLPDGTTNQMRVLVRPRWVKDEVEKGGESWLGERQFRIEVEIYGDYILDCHRQPVDANPVGMRAAPTGNGTPGGTYRSNFRVEPQQQTTGPDQDEA